MLFEINDNTFEYEIEVHTEFSIFVPFRGSDRANKHQNGGLYYKRRSLVLDCLIEFY